MSHPHPESRRILRALRRHGPVIALLAIVVAIYLDHVLCLWPGWFSNDSINHLRRVLLPEWVRPGLKPIGYEIIWKGLVALGGCPESAMFTFQNVAFAASAVVAAFAVANRALRVALPVFLLFCPVVLGVSLTNWSLAPFYAFFLFAWGLSLLLLRSRARAAVFWPLAAISLIAGLVATQMRWEAHYFLVLLFFNLLLGAVIRLPAAPGWLRAPRLGGVVVLGAISVLLTAVVFVANLKKDEWLIGKPRDNTAYRCLPKMANLSGFLEQDVIPGGAMGERFRRRPPSGRMRFYRKYHATNDMFSVGTMSPRGKEATEALARACARVEREHGKTLRGLELQRAFLKFVDNAHVATGAVKKWRLSSWRKRAHWARNLEICPTRETRAELLERIDRLTTTERWIKRLRKIRGKWGIGVFTPATLFLLAGISVLFGLMLFWTRPTWSSKAGEWRPAPVDMANLVAAVAGPLFFVALSLRFSNLEFRYFTIIYITSCLSIFLSTDRLAERESERPDA